MQDQFEDVLALNTSPMITTVMGTKRVQLKSMILVFEVGSNTRPQKERPTQ